MNLPPHGKIRVTMDEREAAALRIDSLAGRAARNARRAIQDAITILEAVYQDNLWDDGYIVLENGEEEYPPSITVTIRELQRLDHSIGAALTAGRSILA